ARRGHTVTGTEARAVKSAPASHAPVRSSATMVSGRLRVGVIASGLNSIRGYPYSEKDRVLTTQLARDGRCRPRAGLAEGVGHLEHVRVHAFDAGTVEISVGHVMESISHADSLVDGDP